MNNFKIRITPEHCVEYTEDGEYTVMYNGRITEICPEKILVAIAAGLNSVQNKEFVLATGGCVADKVADEIATVNSRLADREVLQEISEETGLTATEILALVARVLGVSDEH